MYESLQDLLKTYCSNEKDTLFLIIINKNVVLAHLSFMFTEWTIWTTKSPVLFFFVNFILNIFLLHLRSILMKLYRNVPCMKLYRNCSKIWFLLFQLKSTIMKTFKKSCVKILLGRPRTLILGMWHYLEVFYKTCSYFVSGVKTGPTQGS